MNNNNLLDKTREEYGALKERLLREELVKVKKDVESLEGTILERTTHRVSLFKNYDSILEAIETLKISLQSFEKDFIASAFDVLSPLLPPAAPVVPRHVCMVFMIG